MRVVFMGTPDFAVPTLEALVAAGHEIAAVYTQPPRPAGRGKKERPSPVHAAADRLGLTVRTPERFRDPDVVAGFAALSPDIAVVVAYGQILPQAALDVPALGCVNGHASLLPRWRGAAPIQRAIMADDAETGVCAMRMEAGLDTGPVYARAATPIGVEDTAATLHDRLAGMTAALLAETLPR
ncbi:MAG: methionyl-tRNA formyltransferase, partial [Pseudomonadota bacterium]